MKLIEWEVNGIQKMLEGKNDNDRFKELDWGLRT